MVSVKQGVLSAVLAMTLGLILITAFSLADRPRSVLREPLKGLVAAPQYLGDLKVDGEGRPLLRPLVVAADPTADLVYVADTGRDRVQVYRTNGAHVQSLGRTLDYPNALAVDGQGRLYVGEFRAGRIQVFERDGSLADIWESRDVGSSLSPLALELAGEELFVANRTGEILVLGMDGRLRQKFGRPGNLPGHLAYPNGVTVNGENIIVADSGNARLQVFNRRGEIIKIITRQELQVSAPRGIAADGQGGYFLADTLGNRVLKLDGSFQPLWEVGKEGLAGDGLSFPNGLAVAGSRLYVADRENARVVVYALPEAAGQGGPP